MTMDNVENAAVKNSFEDNAKTRMAAVSPVCEKRCYTVADLQEMLMCGRRTVYDLLKKKEFSYIKLSGAGYRISKRSFDDWLDRQAG